jgi:hypothetical protein
VNEDELATYLEDGEVPDGASRPGGLDGRAGAEGVRRLLGEDATWAEPSAQGADALLAAIRAELPRDDAPAGTFATPGGRSLRPVGGRARPAQAAGPTFDRPAAGWAGAGAGRRRALAAVAAVALVAAGVVGGLVLGSGDDPATPDDGPWDEVALGGTELAPEASALARVTETGSGVEVWLDVEGLPPAAPGTYYQAWLKGDAGSVTIGTFHARDGGAEPVILWSGVETDDYPTITVTLQQEGAGAESSGQVVLSGQVGQAGT